MKFPCARRDCIFKVACRDSLCKRICQFSSSIQLAGANLETLAGNYSENVGTKNGNAPGPTVRSGNPAVKTELRYQALIAPRPHALETDLGTDQAGSRSAIMSVNSRFSWICCKYGFLMIFYMSWLLLFFFSPSSCFRTPW